MKIEFRKALIEELDDVHNMFKAAIKNMDDKGIHQWSETFYPTREVLEEDILNGEMVLGMIDGRLASTHVLNNRNDEEYEFGKWERPEVPYYVIHRVCVNPEFQGMGVGTITMDRAEQSIRELDIKAVRLDAFSKNLRAMYLYLKRNFKITGYVDWKMGRFYLMEKYL